MKGNKKRREGKSGMKNRNTAKARMKDRAERQ